MNLGTISFYQWVFHMDFSLQFKIPYRSPAGLSVEFHVKYLISRNSGRILCRKIEWSREIPAVKLKIPGMISARNPARKMDRIFGQNLVQHTKTLTYIVFQHAI